MRIALLSDIHGNSIALDAVLADIAAQRPAAGCPHGDLDGDLDGNLDSNVDGYCILGDLVALGPDPVGVLERLSRLRNAQFIRGNTDRYAAFGDRPGPTIAEASANNALLPSLVQVANTFAWTQGMITAAGWLAWVRDLPLEIRLVLADGTRFLGVHASPGTDDGAGVSPQTNDSQIHTLFAGCQAELVCVGHTHRPFERRFNGMRIVNPGAVSLSLTADKHACYALLDAGTDGVRIEHRRVEYDRAAVIEQLRRVGHPGRDFLIQHLADPA
jgi:predicted phosphodiesterase